jgi:hypothetical protein
MPQYPISATDMMYRDDDAGSGSFTAEGRARR